MNETDAMTAAIYLLAAAGEIAGHGRSVAPSCGWQRAIERAIIPTGART